MATSFGGSKADTKPSRDVTMQFTTPTEVREVKCVGGQRVKRGDVLIRARDADIIAALNSQRDLAQNELEIQGAEKQLELAQFKLARMKESGQFSPTEYQEAMTAAEVARVQRDQARKNKIQQELKVKQLEGQYEHYYLEAPFDGVIEEVLVEVGQGCNEQEKVLRMVNTDKLWLDPYAPTAETIKLKLKEGSPAWVLVDLPDRPRMVRGKVLYVSPVADSVSQTRRVRVEIENTEQWPAGTQAMVRFTEPSAEWNKAAPAGEGKAGGEKMSIQDGVSHQEGELRAVCDVGLKLFGLESQTAWHAPHGIATSAWSSADVLLFQFDVLTPPPKQFEPAGCLVINSMPLGVDGGQSK